MSTINLNNRMKLLNLAWSNSETQSDSMDHNCEIVLLDYEVDDNIINHWKNKGKLLMCYISVGSYEPWREDAEHWPDDAKGEEMRGWEPKEWWINLDYWELVKNLMTKRMTKLKDRGFQMVEFDNIAAVTDEYNQEKGSKNIAYAKWLSQTARNIGILPVMKNGSDEDDFILAKEVSDYFSAIIIEEALAFDSMCDYIHYKGKPVWMFEYHTKHNGAYSSKNELINAIAQNPESMKSWVSQVSFDEGNGWENVFALGGAIANSLASNEKNKNKTVLIKLIIVTIIIIACVIIVFKSRLFG